MSNLIFSLNATIPIFITLILGILFKKLSFFDEHVTSKINKFVFKVALPAALFKDLATQDFQEVWSTKFVLFCFFATLISIFIVFLFSYFWKGQRCQGEFIQASYRSSAAILGIAFITNLYGNSGMVPLMIVGSVPLFNVAAVIALTLFNPSKEAGSSHTLKKTVKGIITNPIIIGIVIGLIWSLLRIPMPSIFEKTVSNLSVLSSPLGLISMGASFNRTKVFSNMKPIITASIIKLLGLPALFLPIAVYFGFRDGYLIAILIMLGGSTTVSSYIMARNMGHDGDLTSGAIMITTLGCSVTLTFWLFLLKTLGLV